MRLENDVLHVLTLVVSLLLVILWQHHRKGKDNPHNLPYPPGPKPLPIVGNIFDMPAGAQWLGYHKLSERYGDVSFLRVFGQPIVVLGSAKATIDICEKRAAIYSDRPLSTTGNMVGWDWSISLMPYGEWWRRNRRAFSQHLNSKATESYSAIQEEKSLALLRNLVARPEEFMSLIHLSITATVFKIMYDIEIEDSSNEYVKVVEKSMEGLGEVIVPGKYWIDFLPVLRYFPSWLPGAEFKRNASKWRISARATKEVPYEAARLKWNGDHSKEDSLVAKMLAKLGGEPYDKSEEEIVKNVTGVGFAAGSDTTTSSLQSFFFAMAANPEIQKKAQMELDDIIGPHKLPGLADRANLPYIDALTKETLRWQPVVPLAVAHRSTKDDEYMGYFIPKGTIVIPNVWRVLRDPQTYPDPERFNPDRYMKDGKLNPLAPEPIAAFGFGRRICPGRFLADRSLFLSIARVLHVFNLSPPLDRHGRPIHSEIKMTPSYITAPEPFECIIKPRSRERVALLDGQYSA